MKKWKKKANVAVVWPKQKTFNGKDEKTKSNAEFWIKDSS